eukprot:8564284-Pyramimonas_sp.AAC.1
MFDVPRSSQEEYSGAIQDCQDVTVTLIRGAAVPGMIFLARFRIFRRLPSHGALPPVNTELCRDLGGR